MKVVSINGLKNYHQKIKDILTAYTKNEEFTNQITALQDGKSGMFWTTTENGYAAFDNGRVNNSSYYAFRLSKLKSLSGQSTNAIKKGDIIITNMGGPATLQGDKMMFFIVDSVGTGNPTTGHGDISYAWTDLDKSKEIAYPLKAAVPETGTCSIGIGLLNKSILDYYKNSNSYGELLPVMNNYESSINYINLSNTGSIKYYRIGDICSIYGYGSPAFTTNGAVNAFKGLLFLNKAMFPFNINHLIHVAFSGWVENNDYSDVYKNYIENDCNEFHDAILSKSEFTVNNNASAPSNSVGVRILYKIQT